jgi:hypothetical protein
VTAPLIGYGDVEHTLVVHLRARLPEHDQTGVTVRTRYPDVKGHPGRLVLVRRVGGAGPRLGVDVARVDVQVWELDTVKAHDLAHLVRALVHQARSVGPIRGVRDVASPVLIPDPDTGFDRYLSTVDLTLRGASL